MLLQKEKSALDKGTTVLVQKLFEYPLPHFGCRQLVMPSPMGAASDSLFSQLTDNAEYVLGHLWKQ
uniref:Uncharacterized protein n=1 Tax=Zosterops lateralis melanops TaxID=1220523 RepID=A0A8D2Q1K5_ZOSLA